MIEEWRRRLDRLVVDVLERIFYRWVKPLGGLSKLSLIFSHVATLPGMYQWGRREKDDRTFQL